MGHWIWIGLAESHQWPADPLNELLPAHELLRAKTQTSTRAKCFLHGRAWLRSIIADHLTHPSRDIPLLVSASGKPYIEGNPLYCSLSHSRGRLLLALGDQPLGVDLEFLRMRSNWNELAQTICPPPQSRPADEFSFYRCWCRKEAIAKASGQGITDALWQIPVDGNSVWQQWHQPNGCHWYVRDLSLDCSHYAAAIACASPSPLHICSLITPADNNRLRHVWKTI